MLTPREIVAELDKYVIGQNEAKRAVAVALRNRYRRQRLSPELKEEVLPRNIIMIGPTGVGKTEIARRVARFAGAPFIKVEATKFTEVGYVGRDVSSMIRDLTDISVNMVKAQKMELVREKANKVADEEVLDLLFPPARKKDDGDEEQTSLIRSRQKMRDKMLAGEMDKRTVEVQLSERPPNVDVLGNIGLEEFGVDFNELFGKMMPERKKRKTVTVGEARRLLAQEQMNKLVDMDEVVSEAIEKVENSGIVFLDELDKICESRKETGPDVSKGGVQRDILPIVEGTQVATKHGVVRTEHVLFIAAGAFNMSRPSDLIPELQGRFPIRVELDSLSAEDFEQILLKPQNALTTQYRELLATEGIKVKFQKSGVREVSRIAFAVNQGTEDIGARRLHTVMEKLLEDVSFKAPEVKQSVNVDAKYVKKRLEKISANTDLSRYIL